MFTFIDLFAGIGGFRLALESLGGKCIFSSEIDKNACKTYEANFNKIPTGEIFSAKVCQDNSKALMTNPNKALSDWLLRKVLNLKEGELLTIKKINELNFDSVIIYKENNENYKIDKAKFNSYKQFKEQL